MRNSNSAIRLAASAVLALAATASANHFPKLPNPGYDLTAIRPAGFEPMVAGMDFLPNGDLLVVTWRGTTRETEPGATRKQSNIDGIPIVAKYAGAKRRIYRLSGVQGRDRNAVKVVEAAPALEFKDPQGLVVVNGDVYVGDIHQIVKLVDDNNDGIYDRQQVIGKIPSYDGWFEYSFGPVYRDGYLYMSKAVGVQNSGKPIRQLGKDNGTVVRVPIGGGEYEVVAEGLRAPDGIGIGPEGEVFVTDNQGGYRPASPIIHVQKGKWYGYKVNPAGPMQTAANGTMTPPAIWCPYKEANDSPTEPYWLSKGRFKDQFLYGDISRGGLFRAFLEKVDGQWQGGITTFGGGYEVGIHRIRQDEQGHLYIGGLGHTDPTMEHNQGWNNTTFGLQKLIPNAAETFEILRVHSRKEGLEVVFTSPVADNAEAAAKFLAEHWHYEPTIMTDDDYGAPKKAQAIMPIASMQVAPDRRSIYLRLTGMNTGAVVKGFKTGKVIRVAVSGLKSKSGLDLLYTETWYTLNNISPSDPFVPTGIAEGDAGLGTLARLRLERSPEGLRVLLPMGTTYRIALLDLQGRIVAAFPEARDLLVLSRAALGGDMRFLRLQSGGRTWIKRIAGHLQSADR